MEEYKINASSELSTKIWDYSLLRNGVLRITLKGIILDDESLNENYFQLKDFLNRKKVKVYVDNSMEQPYSKKIVLPLRSSVISFAWLSLLHRIRQ
jgi:hypothetical protein